MNIGFIGATGHTNYVVDALGSLRDATVRGVSPGSDGESVDELHNQIRDHSPSAALFDHYKDLLAEDLDLVVVACHFSDLAARTAEALELDYHVYTEKPVATTLKDLNRVRAAYDESKGELAAMLGLRYDSAFATAKRIVQEGSIGEIRLMNCQKSYILGERDEFYRSRSRHGGMIPWVGIHAIDWLHWFCDRPIQTIRARHSRRGNNGHGDLEVSAIVDAEFSDEVFATMSLDYLRPDSAPSHSDDRFRVVGTEGVVEVHDESVRLINPDVEGERPLPLDSTPDPFIDFVGGIRNGYAPRVSAEDSFRSTETSLKARNAADDDELARLD